MVTLVSFLPHLHIFDLFGVYDALSGSPLPYIPAAHSTSHDFSFLSLPFFPPPHLLFFALSLHYYHYLHFHFTIYTVLQP